MTEASKNKANLVRIIGKSILLIFFLVGLCWYSLNFFSSIWRNFKRDEVGRLEVQGWAGCNTKVDPKIGFYLDKMSDEEFTALWNVQSKVYDFTYKDVKSSMLEHCPPQTLEDIETGKYTFIHDKKEVEEYKAVLRDRLQYQTKFLNREFSVLKESQE